MAITAVADKSVRNVEVTCFISPKTEEKLNYHGLRNQGNLTTAQKINEIINDGLAKAGIADLE